MEEEIKKPDNLYTSDGKLENYSLPEICSFSRGGRTMASTSDINLKAGHNRFDVDRWRPEDRIPTTHQEIVQLCQAIYKKNGLIRNIIDLMSDFASEGLDLRHPVKSQERFYKEWAKKVNLESRANDFMKYLMRDASVIIRRKTAIIKKSLVKDMSKAGYYNTEPVDERKFNEQPEVIGPDNTKINKREIPWSYIFLSPSMIEKIGGAIGKYFGSQSLAMRISTELSQSITNPKTKAEKEFVKKLPAEIVQAVKRGSKLIALDPDKIYIDYYKKDDWEDWGTPFLMGIIEEILLKDKMKQADMAALDGVVNAVRLWKLGNSDKQIFPTPAAINKLINILQHNAGGGVMDLVWDDMIDFKIDYPPIDKILGSAKYESVNKDIIRGLGIPDALIGGGESSGGNAQTIFVQLKTLVERLEYVRMKCVAWIENELQLVAEAMEFKRIPYVSFQTMNLKDETAEKGLLIQLLDRNIISAETVHKAFGKDFEIELENMRYENGIREKSPPLLEKANPYNRPLSTMQFQKDAAIELENLKSGGGGENLGGDQPKKEGTTSPGRPPNTKDMKVRKERTPKTLSVLKAMAENFLITIDEIIDPVFLEKNNCKNLRSLTKEKKDLLNTIKFNILACVDINTKLNKDVVETIVNGENNIKINTFYKSFNEFNNEYVSVSGKEAGINEKRSLASSAWAAVIDD
jgi:hypothetical protein